MLQLKWYTSCGDSSTAYVIEKKLQESNYSLKCSICAVCPHIFTCSCTDYAIHNTACKHIHLLCILNPDVVTASPPSKISNSESDNTPGLVSDFHSQSDRITLLRKKINNELCSIQSYVDSSESTKALIAALDS